MAVTINKGVKAKRGSYPNRAHYRSPPDAYRFIGICKQTQVSGKHGYYKDDKAGDKNKLALHYFFRSVVKRTSCSSPVRAAPSGKVSSISKASSWYFFIWVSAYCSPPVSFTKRMICAIFFGSSL